MLGSALQAATGADDRLPRQDRCTRARLGAPGPCHDDRSCHVGRCRFAVQALTIHMRASLAASDSARTTDKARRQGVRPVGQIARADCGGRVDVPGSLDRPQRRRPRGHPLAGAPGGVGAVGHVRLEVQCGRVCVLGLCGGYRTRGWTSGRVFGCGPGLTCRWVRKASWSCRRRHVLRRRVVAGRQSLGDPDEREQQREVQQRGESGLRTCEHVAEPDH